MFASQITFSTVDSQHEAPFCLDENQWFDPNDLLQGFGSFEDQTEVFGGLDLFPDMPDMMCSPPPIESQPCNNDPFVDLVFDDPFMYLMEQPQYHDIPSKEEESPVVPTRRPHPQREIESVKLPKVEKNANAKRTRTPEDSFVEVAAPKRTKGKYMEPFPAHRVVHWKYVLYNLLIEHYNSDDKNTLAVPCEVSKNGKTLKGFSLNQALDPKKRLAELYSLYVRKEDLASEDYSSPFIQDLYKYYLRCALQLMNKFFIKAGPWTYLYDEVILFVPEEDLNAAEMRLRFLEGKKKRKGSD